jgi:hypothetical protein
LGCFGAESRNDCLPALCLKNPSRFHVPELPLSERTAGGIERGQHRDDGRGSHRGRLRGAGFVKKKVVLGGFFFFWGSL